MKHITKFIAVLVFSTSSLFAQQIGDGFEPIIYDFSVPLLSGSYNGTNHIGGVPDDPTGWQHLFTIRHSNATNNHQLQIASSFVVNDRLFFRKIALGSLASQNNSWNEIATRGVNTFVGNQTINNGIININTSMDYVMNFSNPTNNSWQYVGFYTGGTRKTWMGLDPSNNFNISKENGGNILLNGGNVGIGISTPSSKLEIYNNNSASVLKISNNDPASFNTELRLGGTNAFEKSAIISSPNPAGWHRQDLYFV